ncbi:MAG: hypothetical protein ABFD12_07610 [Syntrophorhabdus sp.]
MKEIGALLVMLTLVLVMSGSALADCESDCDGPFQTCVKICRQTTKEDSKEAAACMDNCFRGVSGCQKRCKDKKSMNEPDNSRAIQKATAGFSGQYRVYAQGASCIEGGLTCVLNGTPCCAPYQCKGKFPNTTCQ